MPIFEKKNNNKNKNIFYFAIYNRFEKFCHVPNLPHDIETRNQERKKKNLNVSTTTLISYLLHISRGLV